MTTPAQLLRARYPDPADPLAEAAPLDALEARILLTHVLDWPRTALITRAEASLPEQAVERYRQLVERRLAGEPIAQLVGMREFYGLAFSVTPEVLIPRPETELLVELALEACHGLARPRILDLGTGSGAIAVALAHQRPDAVVTASDRSLSALAVARENSARLLPPSRPGGPISWFKGDWFGALDAQPGAVNDRAAAEAAGESTTSHSARSLGSAVAPASSAAPYAVIVSNPPYIRADDPHLSQGDLRFEPRGALTDEADGLQAIRAIIARAPEFLADGGWLWLEHGYDQNIEVAALLAARGFGAIRSVCDLAGIPRVSGGRFNAPSAPPSLRPNHQD
jgi:release factor glutamine methyltransferase